ncbi:MAG: hypothetical protein E6929_08960 [Clostridium sp.]|nr:hypothetical protein [Clostridium sp.]
MNIYDLIRKLQVKMKDPVFAAKFNEASNIINSVPGLQNEVFRIAQIQDEKAQSAAIAKLPNEVKNAVRDLISLLN